MQQLARATFSSFANQVPQRWQQPAGETGASQFSEAFENSEKSTGPGSPGLVGPSSGNKYHTDTQKMHVAKFGAYIDGICSAICSAWAQWQSLASISGVIVAGPVATGGVLTGPPLMPLIMASAPKARPMEAKYSNVIATVISNAWLQFCMSVKIPGLPLYPAFAVFPGPMAPPMPNVPVPFIALTQVAVGIGKMPLKAQMMAQLGDPMAPLHRELFESIADAFEKSYNIWSASTQVMNMLGTGPIPSFAPPVAPAGPVVGGTATMPPGGLV